MNKAQLPRGVRNNNPGNIRNKTKDKWQGLSEKQNDPSFLQFKDATYGIRAIARLLITYQDKYDCHTVNEFINRWAPPTENDTKGYSAAVLAHLNSVISEYSLQNTAIDMHQYGWLRGMVEAIIQQENGHPWMELYTNAEIDKGLLMAGVQPPAKPIATSRTAVGTGIAATGGTIAQTIAQTQDQISPFVTYLDWAKYIAIGLALAGLLLVLYAKWDNRRKGIG